MLAASERFALGEQLTVSEIDVQRLRTERRMNTTFAANRANLGIGAATRIQAGLMNSKELHLTRRFAPHPFVPQGTALNERCEEIFAIQVGGLAQRLHHTSLTKVVVGISGGFDYTLALLVCVKTFDKLGLSR